MARIRIRVTPRAKADAVVGLDGDGVFQVRVTAAPVDGQANVAVTKVLAKALGVAQRDIEIVAGQTARVKTVEVPLSEEEVRVRLGL